MAKFERGTTVKLKSGGPLMTAGSTDNGYVECFWFDNKNESKHQNFHEEILEEHDGSIIF